MTDLQQMGANFEPPETIDDFSKICGNAPIRQISDYQKTITLYTHGRGKMSCIFKGYEPCVNQEEVINEFNYNCDADTENTADSVFCSHGSGFLVKWDEVADYAHLEKMNISIEEEISEIKVKTPSRMIADEEELLKIFERTYGKIQRKSEGIIRTQREKPEYKAKPVKILPQYLLIDGYNIIFAWDELEKVAKESLNDARLLLINKVANYQAMKKNNVILVFDAYRVKGEQREIETVHGIKVVYTKEAETADSYIEKTSQKLIKDYRVRVATSDSLVQMIIFGSGAERVSAREFVAEIEQTEEDLRNFIKEHNTQ
jgi:predicted RNA-binding protein with PIN domain